MEKITRTRMPQAQKEKLANSIVRSFRGLRATEKQARKAVFSRKPSMLKWIVWWIGKNTEYNRTKVLTEEMYRIGFYAWIHYKATGETIGGTEKQ